MDNNLEDAKARALLEVVRLAFEGGIGIQEPGLVVPSTSGSNSHGKRGSPKPQREAPKMLVGGPCQHCNTCTTPQWRRPRGINMLLCNACGIFFTRYGKLPEQRFGLMPVGGQGEELLDGAAGNHAHALQAPASKRSKGASSQSHASVSEGPDAEGEVASSSASTAIVPLAHAAAAQVAAAGDLLRPSLALLGGATRSGSGGVPSILLPHALQPASQRPPLLPPCSHPVPIPPPPSGGSGPRGLLLLTQHAHSSQRTSERQASKRRGRQPGVESDDSNISTDSHAQAQHEACSSHDEEEHGRYGLHPHAFAAGGPGPLTSLFAAAGAAPNRPQLLLPAPPHSCDGTSPRVSGDGLQAQLSTESINGSPAAVATAIAGGASVIYLPHRTSRGPRSRASSATPGSSFGS